MLEVIIDPGLDFFCSSIIFAMIIGGLEGASDADRPTLQRILSPGLIIYLMMIFCLLGQLDHLGEDVNWVTWSLFGLSVGIPASMIELSKTQGYWAGMKKLFMIIFGSMFCGIAGWMIGSVFREHLVAGFGGSVWILMGIIAGAAGGQIIRLCED